MTPTFVATVGMTMLLLAVVANLLVMRYADGVLQAAVEEGVRQGLAAASEGSCVTRIDEVVHAGLGPMADQVDPARCVVTTSGAHASVAATFAGWLPVVPDHRAQVTASSANLAADG